MTDEARHLVAMLHAWHNALNNLGKSGGAVDELIRAADLIEEMSAKAEEDQTVIAGFEIMLSSAKSAAETWKRRAEAAERDINKVSKYYPCAVCKHWHLGGCKLAADLDEPNWRCNRDTNRFEWRGLCAENGGEENGS